MKKLLILIALTMYTGLAHAADRYPPLVIDLAADFKSRRVNLAEKAPQEVYSNVLIRILAPHSPLGFHVRLREPAANGIHCSYEAKKTQFGFIVDGRVTRNGFGYCALDIQLSDGRRATVEYNSWSDIGGPG